MLVFTRKITVILCFFIVSSLFAQVKDDFGDGNFTFCPTWTGDTRCFKVNTKGQLQLDDTSFLQQKSYLSTPNLWLGDALWQLDVYIGFNTSNHNYCRFYLASNEENLTKASSAYLVEMGWDKDKIVLYRLQNHRLKTFIKSKIPILSNNVNHFALRVVHKKGKWYLLYCDLKGDKTYYLLGSYEEQPEKQLCPNKATGVMCCYTKSRSDKFSFDRFLVTSLKEAPKISLTGGDAYQTEQGDDPQGGGDEPMLSSFHFGDVVFSEIMANPKGIVGLPEVEYLEVYNRSNQAIDLSQLSLHYGNTVYALPEKKLAPCAYAVLCHEKHLSKWKEIEGDIWGMKRFPILANRGQTLTLEDAQHTLVAWVEYADTWYGESRKSEGGVSLSCIDTDCLLGGKRNWCGSKAEIGGTPGQENACIGERIADCPPEVDQFFLLASDTLYVHFTQPMTKASVNAVAHYNSSSSVIAVKKVLCASVWVREAKLVLSHSLTKGEAFSLKLKGLCNLLNVALQGDTTFPIALGEQADLSEVLFNEVLFNPESGGSDYVELYNNSEHYIALDALFLTSENKAGERGKLFPLSKVSRTLSPHAYACFTVDIPWVDATYEADLSHMFAVQSLPSLPDDWGHVVLLNRSFQCIDAFIYSKRMYSSLLGEKEGFALEKINPKLSSSDEAHWSSALAEVRGTPGKENSIACSIEAGASDHCWLKERTFSPNDDGIDDKLFIAYTFSHREVMADVKVYDIAGKSICDVATHTLLSGQGALIWDGMDAHHQHVGLGLYLIYVEVFAEDGFTQHYKLGCAVGR